MAFATARAFCQLSFGSRQNGLAPAANILKQHRFSENIGV